MSHFKKVQPDLNINDLRDFKPAWLESNFHRPFPKKPKRIFVNSMSEIKYWKREWMYKTLEKIKEYPQHTFIFLTKNTAVYDRYIFPENCWLGVTVTNIDDAEKALNLLALKNTVFVSAEPILDDSVLGMIAFYDWLIMGIETGRKGVFMPDLSVINAVVNICRGCNVPVFMKESMKAVWPGELIQQFPTLRQAQGDKKQKGEVMSISTAKQRVLQKLLDAKNRTNYWLGKPVPDGYCTVGILCRADVGGSQGIRRKRDLEAGGIVIDKQTLQGKTDDNRNIHTWIYSLETDPQFIDFQKCCLKQ